MKDFLAGWVALQLVIIGGLAAHAHNAMFRGNTEICDNSEVPIVVGMIIPLAAFIPGGEFRDYCEEVGLWDKPGNKTN